MKLYILRVNGSLLYINAWCDRLHYISKTTQCPSYNIQGYISSIKTNICSEHHSVIKSISLMKSSIIFLLNLDIPLYNNFVFWPRFRSRIVHILGFICHFRWLSMSTIAICNTLDMCLKSLDWNHVWIKRGAQNVYDLFIN